MAKSKFTPEVTEIICEALRKGNYKTVACRSAGISNGTLTSWTKKGKEGIEPYASFLEEMEQAEAEGELALVDIIYENAMNGTWTASAWALERKNPDRWGRKERMELSSDKDFKVEIEGVKSKYEMEEDEKELLKEE